MAKVLIIDDDIGMSYTLSNMIRHIGHEADCAYTISEGREKVFTGEFDVVLLDVMMPDGNGLDLLPEIRTAPSSPEVIVITAVGDPDGAETAIKNGALDYLEKPCTMQSMTLLFVRTLQYRKEKRACRRAVALKREAIIGSSKGITECLDLLAKAANTDASVLITGETGTGKELFAKAIHENSRRSKGNFVVVDCAAMPDSLFESILFGHERGAFTGADRAQDGLIKQADAGTLFLDEIGELPLSIQKGFLRALQERRFRAVGSKQETVSDFRLVAATNRDLDDMAKKGEFRQDLLFRIRSFHIHLPSLRERLSDIKALTIHHVARLSDRYGIGTKGFSPEFFEALASYNWTGNVRELFNVLERTLANAQDAATLFPYHLPVELRVQIKRSLIEGRSHDQTGPDFCCSLSSGTIPDLNKFREDLEKKYLQELMGRVKGDVQAACEIAGISRSRLYALIKKHQITGMPQVSDSEKEIL